jgi:hypothetical protein
MTNDIFVEHQAGISLSATVMMFIWKYRIQKNIPGISLSATVMMLKRKEPRWKGKFRLEIGRRSHMLTCICRGLISMIHKLHYTVV